MAKRQPLPIDVAKLLAVALAVDVGTVLGAAGLVTQMTGPVYRRALPPDVLLGDAFSSEALGTTAPVVAQPRSSVVAMVCGAALGDGTRAGVAFVDRALGVSANVAFDHVTAPFELTFGPDGLVYAFSSTTGYAAALAVVQQAPKLAKEVSMPTAPSAAGVAYEPSTNSLWVASDLAHGIVRVTDLATTSFPLTINGVTATPFNVVAHGGFVYVTVVPNSAPGGVLKVDPSTGTTVQEWRGMGSPFGIANDGTTLFVTEGANLWAIFGSDEDPTPLTFAGPALTGGAWVSRFSGSFWFTSTGTSPPGTRLTRVAIVGTEAVVQADYTFADTSGTPGHVALDVDGFVWATVPAEGEVRILDVSGTTGDPTARTFSVGGTPEGILIL